jgi:arylformamidase
MSGRLYDLSPRLTQALAVFPGDVPLSREEMLSVPRGDPVTLSALRATAHLGSHVDAPCHTEAGGVGVDELALDRFLGPCRLLAVPAQRGGRILPTTVERRLGGAPLPPRLLLATGTAPDPERWNGDFAFLDPALADWLAGRGVRLVGVDTPSVDPSDSKELPAHAALVRRDVTILEGLRLAGIPEGVYELIALPLRLVGFDASPVRAILRAP